MSFNMRVDESDIPMNLRIDLHNAVLGTADNFTVKLVQLFFKADSTNFEKLAEIYPEVADVVRRYKRGEIKSTLPVEASSKNKFEASKRNLPLMVLRTPIVDTIDMGQED